MGSKYKVMVALANGQRFNWKVGALHLIGA